MYAFVDIQSDVPPTTNPTASFASLTLGPNADSLAAPFPSGIVFDDKLRIFDPQYRQLPNFFEPRRTEIAPHRGRDEVAVLCLVLGPVHSPMDQRLAYAATSMLRIDG